VYRLSPPAAGQSEWTEAILYNFTFEEGGSHDGAFPEAGLVMDGTGNLYGTTTMSGVGSSKNSGGRGIVFKLTPPSAGETAWTEEVICSFGQYFNDGNAPLAPVTLGADGAIYGTTSGGGLHASGTVFKMTPPASGTGQWTETILHNFTSGSDGSNPTAGVFLDSAGNVYGNTSVAFKLSPPATADKYWTFKSIYSAESVAALTLDTDGNFYGLGGTSVFRLTKSGSGTTWHPTQLYTFGASPPDANSPHYGSTIGADGNLYYTTVAGGYYNYGGVFKLTKPKVGGTWYETRLYSFALDEKGFYPQGGVVVDTKDNIFGTTYRGGNSKHPSDSDPGYGVVWEISP